MSNFKSNHFYPGWALMRASWLCFLCLCLFYACIYSNLKCMIMRTAFGQAYLGNVQIVNQTCWINYWLVPVCSKQLYYTSDVIKWQGCRQLYHTFDWFSDGACLLVSHASIHVWQFLKCFWVLYVAISIQTWNDFNLFLEVFAISLHLFYFFLFWVLVYDVESDHNKLPVYLCGNVLKWHLLLGWRVRSWVQKLLKWMCKL